MSVSTSRLSYTDCFVLFEAAQEDPLGARMPFPCRADANTYRLRMNTARVIDRKENAAIHQIDHPLYGRSAFDRYIMRIKLIGTQWYLYVEPYDNPAFHASIQPLSEIPEWEFQTVTPSSSPPSGDEPLQLSSASPSPQITFDGSNGTSMKLVRRRVIPD